MNSKTLIWVGVFVGCAIGGWIPTIFGAEAFSFWSIIGNMAGALVGIWLGFKVSQL